MKNIILLFLFFVPAFLFAQYPATGNKQRLGYQTTGDGLIWRGVAADTAIKPRTTANAYFQLDTVNRILRRYIATQGSWQVVGGGTNVDSLIYATRYWVGSNFFPLEGGTLTGTGGAGFIGLPSQGTAPGTPASGLNIFAQGSSFNWKGTDGFERQITSSLTGGRNYALPDINGTFALGTGTADRSARWTGTNTLGAGSWSDNLTRLQAQVPVQFQSVTTAGLPTGVTGYTVYNTTTNGLAWYQGSRWAYGLESTANRFTAGSVIFADANGQATENNANLFFNNSLTRLGIGTTGSPVATLDVNGNIATPFDASFIRRSGSGSHRINLVSGGAGTFRISQLSTNQNGTFSFTDNSSNETIFFTTIRSGYHDFEFRPYNTAALSFSQNRIRAGSRATPVTLFSLNETIDNSSGAPATVVFTAGRANILATGANQNGGGGNLVIQGGLGVGSGGYGKIFVTLSKSTTTTNNIQPSDTLLTMFRGGLGIRLQTEAAQELDVNGDAYIRDSTRLATTPAHTAISGILTKSSTGEWVGMASLAGGLSYSGGVLTGANIYTADGSLTPENTRRLSYLDASYLKLYNYADYKNFELSLNTDNGVATSYASLDAFRSSFKYAGYSVVNNVSGSSDNLGSKLNSFSKRRSTETRSEGSLGVNQSFDSKYANLLALIDSNLVTTAVGGTISTDSLANSNSLKRNHFIGIAKGTNSVRPFMYQSPTTSFLAQTVFGANSITGKFDWLRVDNLDTDTTSNRISFYNGKYTWKNETPGTGQNIHVWDNGTPSFKEIKRDTTIYVDDADYDFSASITTAQIASRFNRVIIWMTTTGAAGSDSELTLHTPDVNLMQVEYLIHSVDEAGGFANVIRFGTNNAVDSTNGLVSSYFPAAGQGVGIRAGLRSSVYKYRYY